MLEYLTADDICNQISMNRTVFKGTVLVSEGATDQRLYGKFTDRDVKIIPAHSKTNVISVINKMSYRKDERILGIVDRDLDDLKERKVSPPVFYTDFRDLEMMLIHSSALDDVLTEYGDADRVDRFRRQSGDIRDVIVSAAYPLGLLMYVSFLRGYSLSFRNLDFRQFIDRRTLKVDEAKMVQAVIANTMGCELSYRNVLKDLQGQVQLHPDKRQIARGHDCVQILLIGLRDNFGAYNTALLDAGFLGGALRLAFGFEEFSRSEIYATTQKWAEIKGMRLWKVNRPGSPRPSRRRTIP
jgi:hypothetical protein